MENTLVKTVLELTHFVGDSLNCDMLNLDDLIELMEEGMIVPEPEKDATRWIEPCLESIEALRLSGYGLGFSPEFLERSGLLESMRVETVPTGAEEIRVWQSEKPVHFTIEDIQTLYVREPESVLTLRIVFPRFGGTFVIYDTKQ